MLTAFNDALMGAELDALCDAPHGVRSPEGMNSRNGYRHRDIATRAGTLAGAIPELRAGTCFPDWLPERRRRAEAALTVVVATCYLLGAGGWRSWSSPWDSPGCRRPTSAEDGAGWRTFFRFLIAPA